MVPAFLLVGLVCSIIPSPTLGTQCPDLFQRYCEHHSFCKSPNPDCEILAYYPTSKEIKQIVALHNEKRSEVAEGQTKLPPAANMLELEWDYELAAVAQSYANQCKYEHDKGNCRRVENFGVGQNIAVQTETGGHTVPQPDWEFAVSNWFAEIRYFSRDGINPFEHPSDKSEDYRHFTQLIWADSFRVGCGYVLYKDGNVFYDQTYTSLYVCNYGPLGNIYGSSVYKPGNICSSCPLNTCCGSKQCSNYQGLCHRTNDDPPIYPPPMPNLFYCGFHENEDCGNYIVGKPEWVIEPTLGGNYLGIVLNGGENSTIVFTKKIKPTQSKFCVTVSYSKGPNKYSDPMSNTADEVLYIPERDYIASQPLPDHDNPTRQMFNTFNLTLGWNLETEFKLSFAVPKGAPPQFLNIEYILAFDGKCKNKS